MIIQIYCSSINNLVLVFSSDRIVTCCCAYNYEILYNEIFVFLFFEGGTENCILPLDLFRRPDANHRREEVVSVSWIPTFFY